jgi:hypothetical protein
MSACKEPGLKTLLFLDNQLSGPELADYSAHLQDCAECEARLQEEQSLSALLRQFRPLYSAPEALHIRLSEVINTYSARRPPEGLCQRMMRILKHPVRETRRIAGTCHRTSNVGELEAGEEPSCRLQRLYRGDWWK